MMELYEPTTPKAKTMKLIVAVVAVFALAVVTSRQHPKVPQSPRHVVAETGPASEVVEPAPSSTHDARIRWLESQVLEMSRTLDKAGLNPE
jgi:hypothetical protein